MKKNWSVLPERLSGYKNTSDYFEMESSKAKSEIKRLRKKFGSIGKVKSNRSTQGTLIRLYYN